MTNGTLLPRFPRPRFLRWACAPRTSRGGFAWFDRRPIRSREESEQCPQLPLLFERRRCDYELNNLSAIERQRRETIAELSVILLIGSLQFKSALRLMSKESVSPIHSPEQWSTYEQWVRITVDCSDETVCARRSEACENEIMKWRDATRWRCSSAEKKC